MKENLEDLKIQNELICEIPESELTPQLLEQREEIFAILNNFYNDKIISNGKHFFERKIREYLKNNGIQINNSKALIHELSTLKERVKSEPFIYKSLMEIKKKIENDIENIKKTNPEIAIKKKMNMELPKSQNEIIKTISGIDGIEIKNIYEVICETCSEYENYSHLSNDEIKTYHDLHKQDREINKDPEIASGGRKKSNQAYEYIKKLYNERVDREFIQSVQTIHWTYNLIDLEKMLSLHQKTKNWDISTVGYKKEESTPSQWGDGTGILIKGDVVWASNQDARSDNKTLPKGHKDYDGKKYSYGDSMGMILNESSFLNLDTRGDGHNEFVVTNWEPEAIIIDQDRKNFDNEDLENILNIAKRYKIKVFDKNRQEIKIG
jgi:hypothetical protein